MAVWIESEYGIEKALEYSRFLSRFYPRASPIHSDPSDFGAKYDQQFWREQADLYEKQLKKLEDERSTNS